MADLNSHKRKWDDSLDVTNANSNLYSRLIGMMPTASPASATPAVPPAVAGKNNSLASFSVMDDLAASVVPQVTVVMDGRSICQRIDLHRLGSYESFARALRRMFVDDDASSPAPEADGDCTLANAIPGYMIAFEDIENDLLLVGDLDWRDFVREARRIRILPTKKNTQKL
ncbi:unnamed protein product [Victoria cruziana]